MRRAFIIASSRSLTYIQVKFVSMVFVGVEVVEIQCIDSLMRLIPVWEGQKTLKQFG